MSRSVDQRVVEMRFDNKQFEQGAKESLSTLEKLKNALNFTSKDSLKGLQNATKGLNLNSIADTCDLVSNRFSAMGIVGATVINRLTNAVIDFASGTVQNTLGKAFNFVSSSIISGGLRRAQNIENAHFQLQALLKDEAKVQEVMNNANASVDGTAYGYDEAAKAASQFAASGVQAGEDMMRALNGITGVAAMTNSEYEGISRIFTTVAGNGRLMGDQLLQLSSRGLNAASTISEFFNGVNDGSIQATDSVTAAIKALTRGTKVSEGEIRDWVSKGKISFEMFAESMENAFGESAGRANETFTGAFSNMKAALARIGAGFFSPLIEQNSDVVKLLNSTRVAINAVKSSLVFDEQKSAISGLREQTGMTEERLTTMFANMKEGGKASLQSLDALTNRGANAFVSLRDYMNGVSNGSIRASYSVKQAVDELTQGTEVSAFQVRKMVENGEVDFATFQAAMDHSFGNMKPLSKQFTDWVLDISKSLSNWIDNLDLTKPMIVFNRSLEGVKNIFLGIWSVLKPIFKGIKAGLFPKGSIDTIVLFAEKFEAFTSKLKASYKLQADIRDTFTGLADVVRLVVEIFMVLFSSVIHVTSPMGGLLDLIVAITGYFGRFLSTVVNAISTNRIFTTVLRSLSYGIKVVLDGIGRLITNIAAFVRGIRESEIAQKIFQKFSDIFINLGKVVLPYFEKLVDKLKDFKDSITEAFTDEANEKGSKFVEWVTNLGEAFLNFDPEIPAKKLENFIKSISDFWNKAQSGGSGNFVIDLLVEKIQGLGGWFSKVGTDISNIDATNPFEWFKGSMEVVIKALPDFASSVKEFVLDSFDKIQAKIEEITPNISGWYEKNIAPIFEGFNAGGVVSTVAGGGILYFMAQFMKNLNTITSSASGAMKSITDILDGVGGALKAYQDNLKSKTLINLAIAIGILSAALIALTFVDPGKLLNAAISLSIVAVALTGAFFIFNKALNQGKELLPLIKSLDHGIGVALANFGRGVKWAAIGFAVKQLGITLALISGSLLAIAYGFHKDKKAMMNALDTIGTIFALIVATMMGASVIEKYAGGNVGKSMAFMGASMLALSLSLSIIVGTISKIFKLKIPKDYEDRLAIFFGVLASLALLEMALSFSARLSGGNKISANVLAMCASLLITIVAIKSLFTLEFPKDWKKRLLILAGIFTVLGMVFIAVGVASRIGGGSKLAAGTTILAMAAFLVVAVGAMFVLTLMPLKKLLASTLVLGTILVALGAALYGAGKVSTPDTYKTVLAMAATIGVIVIALGALSTVPASKLLKAVITLGSVLLVLAVDLKAISKMANGNAWKPVLAMVAVVGVIALSLFALSKQPWQGLLAAAGTISLVLLAFNEVLKRISKSTGLKSSKIATLLTGIFAIAVIGLVLEQVAKQPWQNLIAAAGAISIVLIAYSDAITVMANAPAMNIKQASSFVLGAVAIGIIGGILAIVATQPWQGLIAAATAISGTLLAVAFAIKILGTIQPVNPNMLSQVLVGVVAIALIGAILSVVANQPWQSLIAAAASISGVMLALAVVLRVIAPIGTMGPYALAAIGIFDLFIVSLAAVLAALGALMSLDGFNKAVNGGLDLLVLIGQKLGEAIGSFAASIIDQVTATLPGLGENLSSFADNAKPFFEAMNSLDDGVVEGVGKLALAVAALTAVSFLERITKFVRFGKSSLSQFGESLNAFAPSFIEFAKQISESGMSPNTVSMCQNVADCIAAMASVDIPNEGGFLAKLVGDNNIADYGSSLKKFAPDFLEFTDSLAGSSVSQTTVSQCKAVADSLAAICAVDIPNDGGWLGAVSGENNIADYGSNLKKFGEPFMEFVTAIAGVGPNTVTQCQSVADSLKAICAVDIPNDGGLFGKAAGENNIADYGATLRKFGPDFAEFATSVTGIDVEGVKNAISCVRSLTTIGPVDFTGLENLPNVLSDAAINSINGFGDEFSKSTDKIVKAVNTFVKQVVEAIKAKHEQFKTAGKDAADKVIKGFEAKKSDATKAGAALATALKNGVGTISLYQAGKDAATGFANGLADKATLNQVTKNGSALGKAALDAAKKALDENSPSKALFKVGAYGGEGLANGLESWISKVYKSGYKLGDTAVDVISNSIKSIGKMMDDNGISDPVIKPVIDLSSVATGINDISNMFNQAFESAFESVYSATPAFATAGHGSKFGPNDDLVYESPSGDTYVFNQTNYSPEALSRSDIYRQTKSQFSSFARRTT